MKQAGDKQAAIDPRKSDAFALAGGLFEATKYVAYFVSSYVRGWIDVAKITDNASAVIFGQLLRIDSWLRTLAKLDDPADFQGVAAACRALLETTIDIALLHANPTDHEQLLAWEDSTRLKYAEQLARYLSNSGLAPDAGQATLVAFAATDKQRIDALRTKYGWLDKKQKPFHPERWTARNLLEDAKRADAFGHSFKFERFYETEYRRICWSVHGSAFAIRRIPTLDFPSVAGLMFPACDELGLTSSEIVLRQLGLWSADREADFKEARKRREQTCALIHHRNAVALGLRK